MAIERTLSIIKPDATRRNLTGTINARFEEAGLRIIAQRRIQLTRSQAERFYAVHAERSFYNDLCNYMISGPVVPQVLEGENAIARNREIMGATNPTAADPRHDPRRLRRICRGQFDARLRRARDRRRRDCLLLQRYRYRWVVFVRWLFVRSPLVTCAQSPLMPILSDQDWPNGRRPAVAG